MERYTVAINKVFVPDRELERIPNKNKMFEAEREPLYGGKTIKAIAIYFEYMIYDKKTGKQVFFNCEDEEYPEPQLIDGHDIDEYYSCDFDREYGYIMRPTELNENGRYRVEFRVNGYPHCEVYYVDPFSSDEIDFDEHEDILENEFINLLKENAEAFDSPKNVNVPSTCYDYIEVG